MSETLEHNLDDLIRADGILKNAALKLGGKHDVEMHHKPSGVKGCLSKTELEDLVMGDRMAHRVVTVIPNEMLRVGITLTGDDIDQKKIKRFLRREGTLKAFNEATIYANIYHRGAGIVLDIDDGKFWNEPVDHGNIREVKIAFTGDGYHVTPQYITQFNRYPDWFNIGAAIATEESLTKGIEEITDETNRLEIDPYDGQITTKKEALTKQKARTERLREAGMSIIHKDRVLWFEGLWTPRDAQGRYEGSTSLLQQFWAHYSRYSAALATTANILHRMEILNVKRKGLLKLLAASDAKAQKSLENELELLLKLHTLGISLSDMDNEDITILRRSLGSIPQVLKEFKQLTIAASGLTEMELFGLTTVGGGLSNQDLRDRMHKAQRVREEQEAQWREPMEKYLDLVFNAKEGPTKGKEPEDWDLVFPSALTLTPAEEADLRSKQATTDTTYVEKLSLPADQVLRDRFGSGRWSPETTLPEEILNPPEQEEPTPDEGRQIKLELEKIGLERAKLELEQLRKSVDTMGQTEPGATGDPVEPGQDQGTSGEINPDDIDLTGLDEYIETDPETEPNTDGINLDWETKGIKVGTTKQKNGKTYQFNKSKRWELSKDSKTVGNTKSKKTAKNPRSLKPDIPSAKKLLKQATAKKGAKLSPAEAKKTLAESWEKVKGKASDTANKVREQMKDPDTVAMNQVGNWAAGKAAGKAFASFAIAHGIDPTFAARIGETSTQAIATTIQAIASGELSGDAKAIIRKLIAENVSIYVGKSPTTVDDALLGGDDFIKEYVEFSLENGRKGLKGMVDALGRDTTQTVSSWIKGQSKLKTARADAADAKENLAIPENIKAGILKINILGHVSAVGAMTAGDQSTNLDASDFLSTAEWDALTIFSDADKVDQDAEWERI